MKFCKDSLSCSKMSPKTTKEATEKFSAFRTTVDYMHDKSHKHKHGFFVGLPRP